MNRSRTLLAAPTLTLLLIAATPTNALAQSSNQPEFYKAYYLEKEAKDYAAARTLYSKVVNARVSDDVASAARAGADRCRDHLAAQNFASLMPPDALAYVEITRPGQIIEKLAEMLGLTTNDMQQVLSKRPSKASSAPFHVPEEVAISPALFEVLSSFGGAAFAMTNFDPNEGGPPSGLAVIHHGDAALLKGLLETFFQFSPVAEKIGDMPTFGFHCSKMGEITGVLTQSLLIVGTGRDLVEGAVKRLVNSDTPSLATRDDLSEVMTDRTGATIFAFCDLAAVLKRVTGSMSEDDRQEFQVANVLGDLDHLRWATYSMGIHEGALTTQLAVRYADDHRSIVYNLLRLPPMTRQCLSRVPKDAAGFFGLGLNPALVQAAADAAGQPGDKVAVTGFDIGREFFGNIREVCAFIVPGAMSEGDGEVSKIPNVGILLAVNDVARSKALWNQLLTIPGLVAGKEPIAPKAVQIGETDVMSYAIPEFGRVYLAEFDGCIAIGLTRTALKAAMQAGSKNRSVLDDPVLGKVIEKMPTDSSIMVVAHVGRLAKVAAGSGDMGMAMAAGPAAELCSNTVAWLGLGQSPTQLTLRTSISGLPNINAAIKKFSPMINAFAGQAGAFHQEKDDDVVKVEKRTEKRTDKKRKHKPEPL
ncbi:MAG TPA: hypothetical protein VJZ71_11945 [Phycisphaerae bacterium]|nr:hypothetical protein [Phycisphaerae bacterium]